MMKSMKRNIDSIKSLLVRIEMSERRKKKQKPKIARTNKNEMLKKYQRTYQFDSI